MFGGGCCDVVAFFLVPEGPRALAEPLTEAANAVSRSKETCLHAHFLSVRLRRGHNKAIGSLSHKILIIAWHLLTTGAIYEDPGPDVVTRRSADRTRKRAIAQLEALGLKVIIEEAA